MLRPTLLALLLAAPLLAGCTTLPGFQGVGDPTGPGQRAAEFLRAQPYARILVEVDHAPNAEPEPRALALMEQRLESVTGKPVDVQRSGGVQAAAGGHRYTRAEVEQVEVKHRGAYAQGDRAVIYVLYVDGRFEQDTDQAKTLAAAHRGSSVVMFKANIREASRAGVLDVGKPPIAEVEEAVLVHEMGHLLGLVNMGAPMQRAHEDPQHPRHSTNRNSVMYYAVETSLIGSILGENPPDDFDADDRADLQALRRS